MIVFLSLLLVGGVPRAPATSAPRSCAPRVTTRLPQRNLPFAFYHDEVTSLQTVHPTFELLAERRGSTVGQVKYTLLIYRKEPKDSTIHLSGVATTRSETRAWKIEAECSAHDLPEGIVSTMEAIARLPGMFK